MEEILKDKIFQFYYKKIYGRKSNYLSFRNFDDKDKVSFLISLYLFISNINNDNRGIKENENEINYNIKYDKDFLYQNNYSKIMNEYTNILNKYNNEFYSRQTIDRVKENNKEIILNAEDKLKVVENNKKIGKNISYIKENKDINVIIDTDNFFEEKKIKKEEEIIINSKKNDIDINININRNLNSKSEKNNSKRNNKSKNVISEEYFENQYQNENDNEKDIIRNRYENVKTSNNNSENNLLEISSRSRDKLNNSCVNKTSKNTFNINNDNNNLQNNKNSNNKKNTSKAQKKSSPKKDIVLTEQSITEKSLVHLEEFTTDNLVEKLIKCPQNKYISLNCSEANQIALVIINLMENKNELESEIEEERKKNEIILDKLKLDFEKQKSEIKTQYDKKGNNIIKILGDLEKEINDEKIFLEEEEKGYNLWDHISIENQRTKEIRENIVKKLAGFKK